MDPRELLAIKDRLDWLVYLDREVSLDLMELRESEEIQVHQGLRAMLVNKEKEVLKV